MIPPKANRLLAREFDRHLYKARHLIEDFFAKLKQFRAIATRYDKTARNFLACGKDAGIAPLPRPQGPAGRATVPSPAVDAHERSGAEGDQASLSIDVTGCPGLRGGLGLSAGNPTAARNNLVRDRPKPLGGSFTVAEPRPTRQRNGKHRLGHVVGVVAFRGQAIPDRPQPIASRVRVSSEPSAYPLIGVPSSTPAWTHARFISPGV